MTLVELSIMPVGKGESAAPWIARAVDVIDRSGLAYRVGPMGTCIEGEWEPVCRVIGDCLRAVAEDCNRVSATITIDFRRGVGDALEHNVEAVARVRQDRS